MRKAFRILAIGVAGFVAIVIMIAGMAGKPSTATPPLPTTVATLTAASVPPGQASGPVTEFGSGTYEVGADIKPGKYKTTGPTESDYMKMCYWSRNKNSTGDFGSIIANDIVEGPGVVTVNKGELLKATGNCSWKLAG